MEMTLELDEDVEIAIQAILKEDSGKSFEQVVNELLRTSLKDEQ